MKKILSFLILIIVLIPGCKIKTSKRTTLYQDGEIVKILKSELKDKIKGGWAGQVIGCTYGGPTEFKYNGITINDSIIIPWDGTRMIETYTNRPGLYDDVYMDLTFVEVFEKNGLEAPESLHAQAFANAEYPLWHANQAARYNILNGIMPPASGSWEYNPHADDIDFQIEADFAGLMSPGMANSATYICDKIGHIMNYGDGYYGGVYVAAMYSLAFVYDDIKLVVGEALNAVPDQSEFHKCIADVIRWHSKYPDNWKQTWAETQKKWDRDKACPNGVFRPFNIDAKINAAYIIIGLLYGNGDFGKTIDISTRCGFDSDCNPANAGGILATMIGYDLIPQHWKDGLDKVEAMNFKYTDMSLNRVYEIGMKHAAAMIKDNGGTEEEEILKLKYQQPASVAIESGFKGLFPTERKELGATIGTKNKEYKFDINGCGFVISGGAGKEKELPDTTLLVDVYVNKELLGFVKLPTKSLIRKLEVAWKYDLPEGMHTIRLVSKLIPKGYGVKLNDVLLYSKKDPGSKN